MGDIESSVAESAVTENREEKRSKGISGKAATSRKVLTAVFLLIVVLGAAGAGVYIYIDYADQWVSTNNAFIEGRIYSVSAEIPGKLESINVSEGAFVEKDASLAVLDSTLHGLGVKRIEAAIRGNELTFDKMARRDELRIHLAEAVLLYQKTRILSPAAGYVAHLQAEAGEYVVPGQTLMSVVNLDDLWITANFSEEQVRHIRVGQAVDIFVDAYPEEALTGKVANILPAGGSAFALFPPDATAGNWVRVAQRIPVRIVFDDSGKKDDLLLRIGMLARVRVER